MSEVNQDRCHSVAVGHVTPLTNTICNYTTRGKPMETKDWQAKEGKNPSLRLLCPTALGGCSYFS